MGGGMTTKFLPKEKNAIIIKILLAKMKGICYTDNIIVCTNDKWGFDVSQKCCFDYDDITDVFEFDVEPSSFSPKYAPDNVSRLYVCPNGANIQHIALCARHQHFGN